jgi:hypothetical protein
VRFLVVITKIIGFRLLNVQLYRSETVALVQQFETVKAPSWVKKPYIKQGIR